MSRLVHRLGRRFGVIAALALLFAQLGAVAHAYAHHPAERASSAAHSGATLHNPCGDCLSFAPLLSAAGTPTALPPFGHAAPADLPRAVSASLIERAPALAFRSRAPPRAA